MLTTSQLNNLHMHTLWNGWFVMVTTNNYLHLKAAHSETIRSFHGWLPKLINYIGHFWQFCDRNLIAIFSRSSIVTKRPWSLHLNWIFALRGFDFFRLKNFHRFQLIKFEWSNFYNQHHNNKKSAIKEEQ